jgi:hypothetical protein
MLASNAGVPGWTGSMDEFRSFLKSRLGGRVQDLRLEKTSERCVILQGRTNTYYAKQLAQQAAMEALGDDVELANEIVVC